MQEIAAGTLSIPHTGLLVARFGELDQRLAALMALDIPALIDHFFPDGNAETASIRQTGSIGGAQCDHYEGEFLNELRAVITQPELPGSQGAARRIMSLR